MADLRALAALTAPELAPFLRILLDLREPVEVRIAGRLILVTEAELARLLDAAEREKR